MCPVPARAIVPLSVRRVHRLGKRVNVRGWLFILLVAGLVETGVRMFDLRDSVPTPTATLLALIEGISSGSLSGEIRTTLESYVEGLGLALAGGVVLGVVIGSSRRSWMPPSSCSSS